MNDRKEKPVRSGRAFRAVLALPLLAALAASVAGCATTSKPATLPAAEADVPYRLSLQAFTVPGLPGLHSVVKAVYQGKLVIFAGRTNGMHDFPPQRDAGIVQSFPPEKANNRVYVVDLGRRTLLGSAAVDDLPAKIATQLKSTNAQSFTRDGKIYIVGGYGTTADGSSMQTLDQVLAIDLAGLIQTIQSGGRLDSQFAARYIHAGDHPALAITGGGIEPAGDQVLLAFGQLFNGLYTPDQSVAQQEYSQAVRGVQFALTDEVEDGVPGIAVTYLGKCPNPPMTEPQPTPDGPYHRRDYTLLKVLAPDGSPRIGAFGGVFKGGRMEGYVHPVYLTPTSTPSCGREGGQKLNLVLSEDTASSQWLSQYEGPIIPVYSGSRKAMYTTALGGISQFYWDPATRSLKHDEIDYSKNPPVDGLPFINSVSTLRVGGPGNGNFLHAGEQFPPVGREPQCDLAGRQIKAPYLGANSWFVMADNLPLSNGVLLLDRITAPTLVGYIFGGIASTLPYPGKATCASNVVYAVILDPRQATQTILLSPPAGAEEPVSSR